MTIPAPKPKTQLNKVRKSIYSFLMLASEVWIQTDTKNIASIDANTIKLITKSKCKEI